MTVIKAHGALFKWHNGTSLATVVQCRVINGPDETIDSVETTNMDSTGGKKVFLATLVDAGSITLEIEYDPDDTVHKALIADAEAKTQRAWQITETDAVPTTKDGNGFVSALSFARDFAGILLMNVTIKLTGSITHA